MATKCAKNQQKLSHAANSAPANAVMAWNEDEKIKRKRRAARSFQQKDFYFILIFFAFKQNEWMNNYTNERGLKSYIQGNKTGSKTEKNFSPSFSATQTPAATATATYALCICPEIQ